MRVFADCCINGIKRFSPEYYQGSWDRCEKAAEAIRARIRGDSGFSKIGPEKFAYSGRTLG
jgi:hypothetical protein